MNVTILRLGLRAMFGRRRGILLLILPVVLIGLAILVRVITSEQLQSAEVVLTQLGLHVVLPLVALIATTSVIAPEIDDGSIAYLLAKPISRHSIIASKLLVAYGSVLAFGAAPLLVAGLVLMPGTPAVGIGYAMGALAGGAAYCALFGWLSTLTRHAVAIGLIYVLLWEGLIGGLLGGVRWVSITWWSSSIVESVSEGVVPVLPHLDVTYAVVATLVVVAGLTYLAGRRLQGFNLTGDE